jgi:hypothetical protein
MEAIIWALASLFLLFPKSWFFSLFRILLIGIQCQLRSSLHIRIKKNHLKLYLKIYQVKYFSYVCQIYHIASYFTILLPPQIPHVLEVLIFFLAAFLLLHSNMQFLLNLWMFLAHFWMARVVPYSYVWLDCVWAVEGKEQKIQKK